MYTVDYEPTTEDQVTLGPPSTILCSKGFWVKKNFIQNRKWFDISLIYILHIYKYRFTLKLEEY